MFKIGLAGSIISFLICYICGMLRYDMVTFCSALVSIFLIGVTVASWWYEEYKL